MRRTAESLTENTLQIVCMHLLVRPNDATNDSSRTRALEASFDVRRDDTDSAACPIAAAVPHPSLEVGDEATVRAGWGVTIDDVVGGNTEKR